MSMEALKQLFAKSGLKFTTQRYLVYKAMTTTRDHPSAETVWRRVRETAPAISLDTVYRTLSALEARGLVSRVPCGGDEGRFDGDVTPHHHLVCLSCGRIEDFTMPGADLDDLPPAVAAWGVPRDAQILVRGVCRACLSRMHNVNPQENQRSQSK
ncbi:transcriptional repressor [Solidesulfovibrio sp.]|uniref:Fur family transcriptional regulator n=1 Tax=Solidesulfovibrio sp. TaxID=2910990 RepID=UPI000EC98AC4|nr:transcriptional repressor [Solidesulfovibrio sp.]MEA5087316.1 transcriptional repressor [Solidesulfovibrio sp.]HCR12305.1 transcriptional repressor [Desulfovibrio sp.]HML62583.1 transcriptional repressor [Solidesulfovibrio sp.]